MSPESLSRREFGRRSLASLVTVSLVEALCGQDLFADEIKPLTTRWLADLNDLCRDVKGQQLEQVAWQKKVEELYRQVDLPQLLKLIDFDKLTSNVDFVDQGARSLRFSFQSSEGLPTQFVFGRQIFALKKGRSVVPHGHNNMTTAFLILKGDLRGRHYDRLEDQPEHMIIRPTIDRKFTVGECSTVSDYKDNVHWFQAASDTAFIFNIHVMDVRPGAGAATGRVYVDPNGEQLAGGLIRAKLVDYKTVNQLYG
jgi:hypothetical protein